MEIISRTKPKALKNHICDWCNCKINKGTVYESSFCVQDGDTYTWKNHTHCENIASHLKMFDHDDGYGVTDEAFQETIREEYIRIMSIHHSEIYEYEHFKYPDFEGQLKFVCEFHKVEFNI
ncbi:hypothetical protein [Flavobacterium sp. FlaQc-50]|uniref:hypothetical protein n=1 Tax=unclassified Flavobacterium TaxID=196869 RepID=UPI0037569A17